MQFELFESPTATIGQEEKKNLAQIQWSPIPLGIFLLIH